jgi:hypothetical protein
MKANCTDQEFIVLFNTNSPETIAKMLGRGVRSIYKRRRRLEHKLNLQLDGPGNNQNQAAVAQFGYHPHGGRVYHEVTDGVVLVCGDNHYEPGHIPIMHRAFVKLCAALKPKGVVINGDVCDFARLGKYPRIGWEQRSHVVDEIETAKARLGEIETATFKAWKDWPLGNHDARFNTALANDQKGQEYARINGTQLKDHFPLWEPCWAVHINQGTSGYTIVQHRNRGGEHSAYRNAKELHCHYVTGHDHHPYVRAYTSAVGTVYGINHGMIADKEQNLFVNYTEARPNNWRSAFAVLTFIGSRLLPPELCEKWDDDHVVFRGEVIKI